MSELTETNKLERGIRTFIYSRQRPDIPQAQPIPSPLSPALLLHLLTWIGQRGDVESCRNRQICCVSRGRELECGRGGERPRKRRKGKRATHVPDRRKNWVRGSRGAGVEMEARSTSFLDLDYPGSKATRLEVSTSSLKPDLLHPAATSAGRDLRRRSGCSLIRSFRAQSPRYSDACGIVHNTPDTFATTVGLERVLVVPKSQPYPSQCLDMIHRDIS